jgi:hypothetical protein
MGTGGFEKIEIEEGNITVRREAPFEFSSTTSRLHNTINFVTIFWTS